MIAKFVYLMCAVTSIACASLLVRGFRKQRYPLLLWSSVCFIGLAINNILLFLDHTLLRDTVDLATIRQVPACIGMLLLLVALIWERNR